MDDDNNNTRLPNTHYQVNIVTTILFAWCKYTTYALLIPHVTRIVKVMIGMTDCWYSTTMWLLKRWLQTS